MTPGARVAAAIEVLDLYLSGVAAEKALTNWARRSRFAGSGDRAAIRDHVFDALRNRRSFAARGGAETGRGLMIGALRAAGADPASRFTGEGHAPAPLSPQEAGTGVQDMPDAVALDCPDWLLPRLQADLGADMGAILALLKRRAPVFLRVNRQRMTVDGAAAALARDGIQTRPHALSATALEVTANPRRVAASAPYRDGAVELQDAASQWATDQVPLRPGARLLDYCAGGGGKALALAARGDCSVVAHDIDPARMGDLPARAARAGVEIPVLAPQDLAGAAPFDVVFCDAPCSGSGAWRRSPAAKWTLSPERLKALCDLQDDVLDVARRLVVPGGILAYATCSMFTVENRDRVDAFLARQPDWKCLMQRRLTPLDGGDGFYIALLLHENIDR